jgi:hypothetical protein
MRAVVMSPHPDDATLAVGGLIATLRSRQILARFRVGLDAPKIFAHPLFLIAPASDSENASDQYDAGKGNSKCDDDQHEMPIISLIEPCLARSKAAGRGVIDGFPQQKLSALKRAAAIAPLTASVLGETSRITAPWSSRPPNHDVASGSRNDRWPTGPAF